VTFVLIGAGGKDKWESAGIGAGLLRTAPSSPLHPPVRAYESSRMLVRRTADYPDRERVYLHILNGSMDCIYEVSLRRPDTFDPGVPVTDDMAYKEVVRWRQIGVIPRGPSVF